MTTLTTFAGQNLPHMDRFQTEEHLHTPPHSYEKFLPSVDRNQPEASERQGRSQLQVGERVFGDLLWHALFPVHAVDPAVRITGEHMHPL